MQEYAAAEKPAHGHAVACDGGGGALGHPKVYLSFQNGRVVCPYCGRRFVEEDSVAEVGA